MKQNVEKRSGLMALLDDLTEAAVPEIAEGMEAIKRAEGLAAEIVGAGTEADAGLSKEHKASESLSEEQRTAALAAVAEKKARNLKGIYAMLEKELIEADIPGEQKVSMLQKIYGLSDEETNIMIVGATGAGKSSTINALFNTEKLAEAGRRGEEAPAYREVAEVGIGAAPETQDVDRYELGNLVLWDTPGLGDGKEADAAHRRQIIKLLSKLDEEGRPLIDLVLVILDASSKDLGTSYELINEVIIPALGKDRSRILIGINQSDIAMHGGRHWDYEKNEPDEVLKAFLEEKAASVAMRVFEATGVETEPVCYCAGFKEPGETQQRPYNLSKLLYYIVSRIPAEKRLALVDALNDSGVSFCDDDEEEDYRGGILSSIADSVFYGSDAIADSFGDILGFPGRVVGHVVGAALGLVFGVVEAIFG